MAPKAVLAASEEYSSHESSSLYSHSTHHLHLNGGLELSPSSHSIAKAPKTLPKRVPIIRVVHVFAPTLIKTNVANFRTLVQELTGNHSKLDLAKEEEEEAKEESGHDYEVINPPNKKQLELRYPKEREATFSTMLRGAAHLEDNSEDPFLHFDILQAGLASNHARCAMRFDESIDYFATNQAGLARIEERGEYMPTINQGGLARNDEGISCYFPHANCDYDDAYSYGSPSSLDSSSTRGDSHTSYERGNNSCVFDDELDLMAGFNSSYSNLDDHNFPQIFMSSLDTRLESSFLNPTW